MALALHYEPNTGSSVHGTTEYYAFFETLNKNTSYASIDVTDSEDDTFQVQNRVFVVPSMTQINGSLLDITIASKDPTASITVDVTAPTGQQGTIGPKITRQGSSVSKAAQATGSGYQLWQTSVDLGLQVTGAVAVNAVANGHVEDVFYLNPGVAGW